MLGRQDEFVVVSFSLSLFCPFYLFISASDDRSFFQKVFNSLCLLSTALLVPLANYQIRFFTGDQNIRRATVFFILFMYSFSPSFSFPYTRVLHKCSLITALPCFLSLSLPSE
jgi:hypothetical protein